MSKVDVRTGPYSNTPVREGNQAANTPEAVRHSKLHATEGLIWTAINHTYPDILVPDTIGERLAGDTTDRDAAARIASSPAAQAMIQAAVQMQQSPELQ